MKLWQKISLVCVCVLLAVVSATSALLLASARNGVLDLTVSSAKEKQSALCKSFANMMRYYPYDGMSAQEEDQAILYCFSTFADETCVLVSGDEILYSYLNIRPNEILPVSTAEQRVFIDAEGTGNLLIVGSLVNVWDQVAPFCVYVVQDISGVYRSFQTMVVKFMTIAGGGILLGTLAIVLLVRATSRPLKKLSKAARRIADGQYAERADVRSHDEVRQLADDFNRMADAVQTHVDALEEKNANQEMFIGGLTHEFKTPMTSMMLHSETLLTMKLTQEQRDVSLMHIHTQCAWLERLTQKLLSLITLGKDIHKQEYPVSELFDSVEESTHETMEKRGTPLKTACNVDTLPMDPDLLQSVLINLVDNASKASQPGQEILLHGEGRTLAVTDHGRGIPQESIHKVTEPFYMVDKSRSKKMGGSGLGLALVKRIVDAHGCVMEIDSKPGEGTTISIRFPETPPEE